MNTYSFSSPSLGYDLRRVLSNARNGATRARCLFLFDAIGPEATRALVEVKRRRLEAEHPRLRASMSQTQCLKFVMWLAFLEVRTGRLWE